MLLNLDFLYNIKNIVIMTWQIWVQRKGLQTQNKNVSGPMQKWLRAIYLKKVLMHIIFNYMLIEEYLKIIAIL